MCRSRSRRIQITADLQNNDKLHCYSQVHSLIKRHNTKSNVFKKRMKRMQQLIILIEHLLITGCMKFTRRKELLSKSTQCNRLLYSAGTLARLIIFHQLKGQIILQPPSYSNESTQGGERKPVMATKCCWQEIYLAE